MRIERWEGKDGDKTQTEESRHARHESDPGRPCETPGGGGGEVDRCPCHWRAFPQTLTRL